MDLDGEIQMSVTIKEDSTLECLVTVDDGDTGSAKVITGATITANATKQNGAATKTSKAATTAITDATAGQFTATFGTADFADGAGKWIFQARVVLGAESEVVVEDHIQVDAANI